MDDLIQCKHTGQRGRDNECFDCGKRVVSTKSRTNGRAHQHRCRVCCEALNWCTRTDCSPVVVCDDCKSRNDPRKEGEMESSHWHRCSTCFVKWTCSDGCTRRYEPPNYQYVECQECQERYEERMDEELKFELDRFAAFIEAIRDLLRWLHVVEKLERKADLFFYLVQETATWCACPRDCDGVTHDDCECSACDAWVAISKQTETDRALAEEGEAILAKGATQ